MPGAAGVSCRRCPGTASGRSGGGVGSREEILGGLRAAAPPARELPEVRRFGARFPARRARFALGVQEVGGRCVPLPSLDDLPAALEQLEPYRTAARIASAVPGVPRANVPL